MAMCPQHPFLAPRILLGLLFLLGVPLAVQGVEFRVDTQIFLGDGDLPVSENTTLFSEEDAFDSIAGGTEITVFKGAEDCFVLLDLNRKLKTRITTDQLLQYTALLKEKASKSKDPLLKFCAQPKFDVRREDNGKNWQFYNQVLHYQILTHTAKDEAVAEQYRRFCDWYARLNAMLRPQALLPFPRLVVNERIAREAAIPKTVRLQISPQRRTENQPFEIRSVHALGEELSPAEERLVEQFREHLATFEEVPVTEYRAKGQALQN